MTEQQPISEPEVFTDVCHRAVWEGTTAIAREVARRSSKPGPGPSTRAMNGRQLTESRFTDESSRPMLVVLESPYAGDVEANLAYARACVADSLARGEAPIASHLLYTQPGILDDADPTERAKGIAAGHAWIGVAAKLVVYTDLGISRGMEAGIAAARGWAHEVPVEYRTLH